MGSIKTDGVQISYNSEFYRRYENLSAMRHHRQAVCTLRKTRHRAWGTVRRLDIPKPAVYKVMNQLKIIGNVDETRNSRRPRTLNTGRTRGIIRKRYWSQLEQGGIIFRNRTFDFSNHFQKRHLVDLLSSPPWPVPD
uniref:Uncharacterized protein n=1 Tax=Caenorhabditis japonica TaxID=281687 RepID=A0A8R1I6N2_CAEJA